MRQGNRDKTDWSAGSCPLGFFSRVLPESLDTLSHFLASPFTRRTSQGLPPLTQGLRHAPVYCIRNTHTSEHNYSPIVNHRTPVYKNEGRYKPDQATKKRGLIDSIRYQLDALDNCVWQWDVMYGGIEAGQWDWCLAHISIWYICFFFYLFVYLSYLFIYLQHIITIYPMPTSFTIPTDFAVTLGLLQWHGWRN